ncbi:MAG TPA: hypothetical protein PK733_09275 [Clostridiales bacterium]|nr:hypothetical protein [Clostridiales bacterium]
MTLGNLKQQMLLPNKEYIINQHVNIRGLDVLLLSFTIEENKNKLWLMYEDKALIEDNFHDEFHKEFKTNREEMLCRIEVRSRHINFYIKEMEIQGHIVRFSSSRNGPVYESNMEARMQLQHFAEKGLIPSEWDDVRLESLVVAQYEQMEGEVAPYYDNTRKLPVVLHIDRNPREAPIQCPFKVNFGKQDIGTKITYYDPVIGRESYFFINEIYSYDAYDDILKKTEQIEDTEMRENMIKHHMEAMENLCPKDKNLAVIRYETADNVQLRFMMKDYLEAQPVHHSSATAIGFICRSDEMGINGYKVRECALQPVDKDFNGELELELFSRSHEIPEETVYSFLP